VAKLKTLLVFFFFFSLGHKRELSLPITTPPTFVNVLVVRLRRNPPPNHTHNTQRRCWVEEGEYKREEGERVEGGEKTLVFSLSLSQRPEKRGGLSVCIRAPPLSEMADQHNTHTQKEKGKDIEALPLLSIQWPI